MSHKTELLFNAALPIPINIVTAFRYSLAGNLSKRIDITCDKMFHVFYYRSDRKKSYIG
jgi:hypothetical protein